MKPVKKTKLGTFELDQEFDPNASSSLISEALKLLNLHYFNDPVCNHLVDGVICPKYPEIEKQNPAISEAHYNIRRGTIFKIVVDLYSDGSYVIKTRNTTENERVEI